MDLLTMQAGLPASLGAPSLGLHGGAEDGAEVVSLRPPSPHSRHTQVRNLNTPSRRLRERLQTHTCAAPRILRAAHHALPGCAQSARTCVGGIGRGGSVQRRQGYRSRGVSPTNEQ